MDIKDTVKRLKNRDLSRRGLNKALAAVGLTAAVMPLTTKSSRASEEAIYYTWAGYDVPEMWSGYVDKHGAQPELPTYGDAEECFTKIRAGFVVSRLSNWKDVIPGLKNVEGTVVNGEHWFIPWEWGQTSVTYRTDLFDLEGKEESWGMLWDERYKGRLSIIDAAEDSWWCAAIYAGVDFANVSDSDIEKVKGLLEKQQDLLRFRQSDSTTLVQALASGEVVAAMTWSDVPTALIAEGVPVKFAEVKEGGLTWVCGLTLASNAPNVDKAYDLLDALLSPESGQYCIGENAYGHSNAKSFDLFTEEELTSMALSKDPKKVLDAGVFLVAQPEEIEQKINRDWGDLISNL